MRGQSERLRVRVFRLGEHLLPPGTLPRGALARLSGSGEGDEGGRLAKGTLLRAAHGAAVRFDEVDYTLVRLLLLPSGDEVANAGPFACPTRCPRLLF